MRKHLGSAIVGGILSGIVAAACMSLVAMLAAALSHDQSWYSPLELAGGVATGSSARFDAGIQLGAAIAGGLLHFTIGAAWGFVFGVSVWYFLHHLLPNEGAIYGSVFGIAAWVIDLAILKKIDPPAAFAIPLWIGCVTHLGYGVVLGTLFHRLRPHHAEELKRRHELDSQRPKSVY